MKKLAITAALAASVFTLSACTSSAEDSETIVATDNGEVTKEEFYQELKKTSGEQVIQQLVMKEVLANNYDVSDEEVNKELESMKEQYGDQFDMVLQQYGMSSEDQLKETIRFSLLQEKAASEDIEVTEEDMKNYYERMKQEVQASHILVKDEKTAKEVKQKLEDGEAFDTLASEYSQDGSAQQGGKLGYFGVGKMTPKFEEAAYSLDVGEISEPVKTQYGYHIIKVTDKREVEDVEPYDEVKDEIKRTIVSQRIDRAALQEKMDKLVQEANLDVKVDEYKGLFEKPESNSDQSTEENKGSEESTDSE